MDQLILPPVRKLASLRTLLYTLLALGAGWFIMSFEAASNRPRIIPDQVTYFIGDWQAGVFVIRQHGSNHYYLGMPKQEPVLKN